MAFLFLFIILHLFIFFCVFVNNYENNMITSLIFVHIFKRKILTFIYINDNIYKKICIGVFLCKNRKNDFQVGQLALRRKTKKPESYLS